MFVCHILSGLICWVVISQSHRQEQTLLAAAVIRKIFLLNMIMGLNPLQWIYLYEQQRLKWNNETTHAACVFENTLKTKFIWFVTTNQGAELIFRFFFIFWKIYLILSRVRRNSFTLSIKQYICGSNNVSAVVLKIRFAFGTQKAKCRKQKHTQPSKAAFNDWLYFHHDFL